jgi:hypothetical protein
MKIIQRGTAENSLIKINVYHGANGGGAYLFRISTWQKKASFKSALCDCEYGNQETDKMKTLLTTLCLTIAAQLSLKGSSNQG